MDDVQERYVVVSRAQVTPSIHPPDLLPRVRPASAEIEIAMLYLTYPKGRPILFLHKENNYG